MSGGGTLPGKISAASERYWDENREKAGDPAFWMAHPLCREAINRRVSGSPDEWPLDWFKRVYAAEPFARGVSWGCGMGAFERSATRSGVVREIDAFDISGRSLESARAVSQEERISCVHYAVGDFDDPRLPRARYDIAFFHAALHHVSRLERLFRRLEFTLKPGGAIYLDEYVGPSRDRWRTRDIALAQSLLNLLPEEAAASRTLVPPIEPNDPSEAIRSQEIPAFFERFFEKVAWRPYGGQVVDLLFPYLRASWVRSPAAEAAIRCLLEIEDYELLRDPSLSHHVVAFGRLRRRRGPARALASRAAAAARRAVARRTVRAT